MSDRTPEDEALLQKVDSLLEEIVTPVIRAAVNGIDPTALAIAGTEKMTDFILADRKAQATAMLEKGPKDIPLFGLNAVGKRLNEVNQEWRSIIKEVGGLDE